MDKYQIGKAAQDGYIKMLDGIERKTLVYGEKTVLVEFKLKKGSVLPLHKHPHEQTGYLVSGHIILNIAGENHEMKTGDSWCIQGDIEHSAAIEEDSVAIEVFCPLREDYL